MQIMPELDSAITKLEDGWSGVDPAAGIPPASPAAPEAVELKTAAEERKRARRKGINGDGISRSKLLDDIDTLLAAYATLRQENERKDAEIARLREGRAEERLTRVINVAMDEIFRRGDIAALRGPAAASEIARALLIQEPAR